MMEKALASVRFCNTPKNASFCFSVRGRLDFWIVCGSSSSLSSGISAITGTSSTKGSKAMTDFFMLLNLK
jgi:hypothetical protein